DHPDPHPRGGASRGRSVVGPAGHRRHPRSRRGGRDRTLRRLGAGAGLREPAGARRRRRLAGLHPGGGPRARPPRREGAADHEPRRADPDLAEPGPGAGRGRLVGPRRRPLLGAARLRAPQRRAPDHRALRRRRGAQGRRGPHPRRPRDRRGDVLPVRRRQLELPLGHGGERGRARPVRRLPRGPAALPGRLGRALPRRPGLRVRLPAAPGGPHHPVRPGDPHRLGVPAVHRCAREAVPALRGGPGERAGQAPALDQPAPPGAPRPRGRAGRRGRPAARRPARARPGGGGPVPARPRHRLGPHRPDGRPRRQALRRPGVRRDARRLGGGLLAGRRPAGGSPAV
ncbi:MAG: hypothetical protein AVDCRST_MAG35-2753, partial [uncultured Quadrisphaera sp.]